MFHSPHHGYNIKLHSTHMMHIYLLQIGFHPVADIYSHTCYQHEKQSLASDIT